MSEHTGRVLRSKLKALKTRGYSFPLQSVLSGQFEHAAARGASTVLGVAVEAMVTDSRVEPLAELVDGLPVPGLFVLLEGRAGETALVALEMRLVDHIVEILAGGEPDAGETLPTRTPTDIDAALASQVIATVMTSFRAELAALADGIALEPLDCGRVETLPTSLQFLLPEQKYLMIRGNLDIGDGARSGDLSLALPLTWLEPVEEAVRHMGAFRTQGESEHWRRHMRAVARLTPLPLAAVIERRRMSVGELSRLKAGDVFRLSEATLDDVVLELDTGAGPRPVARGRLGSYKQTKAIRLSEPPDREFFEPLAGALFLEFEEE